MSNSNTSLTAKTETAESSESIGYLELGDSYRIEVLRVATGRDMLNAQRASKTGEPDMAALLAPLLRVNGESVSPESIAEWDVGVVQAIQEVIMEEVTITPDETNSDLKYPKVYHFPHGHTATLTESRKQKHDTEAQRLAGKDQQAIAYWIVSKLILWDGEKLRFDDLLDLPMGMVLGLIELIIPKKPQFIRAKR